MLAYLRASLRKKIGYTLIEVLVVCLILSVLLAALFVGLTSGNFSSSVSSAKVDLQSKIRIIMDWILRDVRQTNLVEINTNAPTADHIKFKKVTGIDNNTGNYTLSADFIEYTYNSASSELTRNEIDGATGSILKSVVFSNMTQSPFYSAPAVPLAPGDILTSKRLVIVIAGRNQVRNSLVLNLTLTEEVKIRNE